MKKVATAVLAGMFFVGFSASANEIQKPDFLAHTTDAVFVGEAEMAEVRGENWKDVLKVASGYFFAEEAVRFIYGINEHFSENPDHWPSDVPWYRRGGYIIVDYIYDHRIKGE